MFIKIPFESKIKLDGPVYEITKMSLEHEFTLNGHVALGNFILSGLYRAHEVSVNKENFNYTLPFQVDLDEDIDLDTVEFDIEDFNYNIANKDTLDVNIIYCVKADVLKRGDEFMEAVEVDFEEELDKISDERLNVELKVEGEEQITESDNIVDTRDDTKDAKDTIINNIKYEDDNYLSYHVHIVKENESIDSICTMYNTNSIVISEYNDISDITVGDKIIIPFIDE